MPKLIRKLLRDEAGSPVIEYGLSPLIAVVTNAGANAIATDTDSRSLKSRELLKPRKIRNPRSAHPGL